VCVKSFISWMQSVLVPGCACRPCCCCCCCRRAGRGSEGTSVVGSDSVSDYAAAEPLEVHLGAVAAGLSAAKRIAYMEGVLPTQRHM
jgi:hypothetical protein